MPSDRHLDLVIVMRNCDCPAALLKSFWRTYVRKISWINSIFVTVISQFFVSRPATLWTN